MGNIVKDTIGSIFGGSTSGQESAGQAAAIQSRAYKEAGDIQAAGYRKAGDIQAGGAQQGYDIFSKLFGQGQGYLDPYQKAGTNALNQQQGLLGLLGPEEQAKAYALFNEAPGQQFAREQQEKTILRNAAATGGLGGGNVLKALQENAAGNASQNFNSYLANIGALSTQGQNAAQFGAQYNMQGGQGLSNLAMTKQNALANAELGSANAYASGLTGAAGAQAGGILSGQQANAATQNSLLNLGGTLGAAFLLSDATKKEPSKPLDLKKCYDLVKSMPLKVWRYLESTGLDRDYHLGPMAQDAPQEIKVPGKEALNVHDELMLIAGAIQYMARPKFNLIGRAI